MCINEGRPHFLTDRCINEDRPHTVIDRCINVTIPNFALVSTPIYKPPNTHAY